MLTKSDLSEDAGIEVERVTAANPGVDVVATSAATGAGIEDARVLVRGRTVVLLGESGCGKSTLANALIDEQVAETGAVRSGDHRGRHTTTARHLHLLPGGGVLIDTPGIRSVGMWIDPDAVDAAFADVEAFAGECRFADCRHDTEPGCGVQEAVANGELGPDRLAAWAALRREAESAALRADPKASRAEARRGAAWLARRAAAADAAAGLIRTRRSGIAHDRDSGPLNTVHSVAAHGKLAFDDTQPPGRSRSRRDWPVRA